MIVALLNQKGGVGKTTLATHIAGELALRGQNVILLDADPQGSSLDWTQRRSQQGLPRLFSAVGLARETLHQEAPELARRADHVIIDGPPRIAALARSALLAAERVLIPVQPSPYDLWVSAEMVALIREAQVFRPALRAAFVINRRVSTTVIGREARQSLAEQPLTVPTTTANAPAVPPRPRSRRRARLALAGFAAVGFAALAWAAFVSPLPRLTYNPSDSVAVGWYRIEPFAPRTASLPRPLSVDSIVLVPLPAKAAMLAAQRGYLPTRVPLLKRVGAVAPQHVCIVAGQVRIDGEPAAAALPADRLGRPLPSLQLCRRLEPGELFLLSATNPASFDSRYFGPVSASAVIGVAHPVWLETRP